MRHTVSLKKNSQFRVVYHRGKSFANRRLVLYALKNGKTENALGVSVSKKVGKSVVRSRVSRLIKESYRLDEEKIKTGYDLVFIARNAAAAATFWEIQDSMRHLLKKQGLLLPEEKAAKRPETDPAEGPAGGEKKTPEECRGAQAAPEA